MHIETSFFGKEKSFLSEAKNEAEKGKIWSLKNQMIRTIKKK